MFTKKPAIVVKYFIGKAAHSKEQRKILVFSIPGLSPSLIAVNKMLLKDNVSKCLTYGKAVSETLVKIEQKSKCNNQMSLFMFLFLLLYILSPDSSSN